MYERILAPIEGSATSQSAFKFALSIARGSGAELIPLFVVEVPISAYEMPGGNPMHVHEALLKEGQRLKDEALAAMQFNGVRGNPRVVEVDAPGGSVPERILDVARATHCDLVVMGTHGRRGVKRLMLGSVAERFVRMSSCPVLLIPGAAFAVETGAASAPETEDASS
ncbi:universal stress protein [Paraburkholderia sp. A1RI-2L]|uniref:universal stress protein n=1 Tax=Paraburkholderia sp. A1RI-2L TaxID=3028367 RepID=UPI003B81B2CD